MKAAVALLLLLASSAAAAAPLTVRIGEDWVFTVRDGDPTKPRKVAATAKPAKGQVMVSVRRLFGTSLIATNNSGVAYRFRAELLSGGKAITAKSCSLPADGKPVLEQWPQKAEAVRIGRFVRAADDGSCP